MADPGTAAIALKVFELISEALKAVKGIDELIRNAKEFPDTITSIQNELNAIVGLLQDLYQDLDTRSQDLIPPALEIRVNNLVSTSEEIIAKVNRILVSYQKSGVGKYARFLRSGKEDMEEVKQQLQRLKLSLDFAVDMMTLSITKNIKADTGQLLADTHGLHLGQKEIMEAIHGMRSDDNKVEDKQVLEELQTVRFDRENLEDLIGKMQALLRQDPGNFLVQRYLDSMTNYAESTIDPNEYVPIRDSIWQDPEDPPEYCFEDARPSQDLKPTDDTEAEGYFDQVKRELPPTGLHKRSMSTPIDSAPRDALAQRQMSGDFSTQLPLRSDTGLESPSPTVVSVSTEARSPTSPRTFSPKQRGSLTSSLSQITNASVLPDPSWVEKQWDARHAREHTDSKTLRKLNGQLRCISSATSQVVLEGLILKGADPNALNRKLRANVVDLHGLQSKEGLYNINRCALVNAICARNIECVRMLLAYGADPNIDDGSEQSCLFFAVAYGEEEIVEALIRAKADVNRVENLDVICAAGGDYTWPSGSPFLEDCQLPDEAASKVEIHCHSALMTAVSMATVDWHPRRYAIINLLLAHAADATEKAHKDCHSGKDQCHMTPLEIALTTSFQLYGDGDETAIGDEQPAMQICRLLLDSGANVNSLTAMSSKKTQWLVTPLDRVVMLSPAVLELAGLLIERGGSLSLGIDGAAKASKSQVGRLASGMNMLLIVGMAEDKAGAERLESSQQSGFSLQWMVTLLTSHRVLGVAMILQLVAEFSFDEEEEGEEKKKAKEKEDAKHIKPQHYGREELETAIRQLRRCGITSREEGQIRYMRRKRFYDKNQANWAEGQINALTLIREMRLDETKISRDELVKLVDGPLLG